MYASPGPFKLHDSMPGRWVCDCVGVLCVSLGAVNRARILRNTQREPGTGSSHRNLQQTSRYIILHVPSQLCCTAPFEAPNYPTRWSGTEGTQPACRLVLFLCSSVLLVVGPSVTGAYAHARAHTCTRSSSIDPDCA